MLIKFASWGAGIGAILLFAVQLSLTIITFALYPGSPGPAESVAIIMTLIVLTVIGALLGGVGGLVCGLIAKLMSREN